jgi:hypothetical protein
VPSLGFCSPYFLHNTTYYISWKSLEMLISKFQARLTLSENISQRTTQLVLKYWQSVFEYCLSCLAKNVNYPTLPHTAYISMVSQPHDYLSYNYHITHNLNLDLYPLILTHKFHTLCSTTTTVTVTKSFYLHKHQTSLVQQPGCP